MQYLSTQQPGYQNRVIHMVNPQSATLPLQSLGTSPGTSAQVLLSGVPGGGVYGQQMTALASSLGVGGQMEVNTTTSLRRGLNDAIETFALAKSICCPR